MKLKQTHKGRVVYVKPGDAVLSDGADVSVYGLVDVTARPGAESKKDRLARKAFGRPLDVDPELGPGLLETLGHRMSPSPLSTPAPMSPLGRARAEAEEREQLEIEAAERRAWGRPPVLDHGAF